MDSQAEATLRATQARTARSCPPPSTPPPPGALRCQERYSWLRHSGPPVACAQTPPPSVARSPAPRPTWVQRTLPALGRAGLRNSHVWHESGAAQAGRAVSRRAVRGRNVVPGQFAVVLRGFPAEKPLLPGSAAAGRLAPPPHTSRIPTPKPRSFRRKSQPRPPALGGASPPSRWAAIRPRAAFGATPLRRGVRAPRGSGRSVLLEGASGTSCPAALGASRDSSAPEGAASSRPSSAVGRLRVRWQVQWQFLSISRQRQTSPTSRHGHLPPG